MTEPLSPAAQAVLDQAIYKGPELEKRVAAALRAAADQVLIRPGIPRNEYSLLMREIDRQFRAIAAELDHCQRLLLGDGRQRHPLADHARAALAKADGPAVPDGREPASVALQPSDGELWTMYDEMRGEPGDWAWVRDLVRAALSRWGHHPAPPADGEVAEVAAWLRLFCSEEYESRSFDPDVAWLTRAADLLQQQAAPAPPGEERIGNWLLPEKPPLPEHWSGDLEYGFETAWETARALLAEPVAEGPTDEKLLATLNQAVADFPPRHPEAEAMNAVEYALALELRKARAVLDRWGHHPAPPADGEVGELAEWLRTISKHFHLDQLGDEADQADRAAALLERFASPACLVIDPGEEALASRMTARIVGPGRIKAMPAYMQIIEPAEHTLLVPVAQPVPVSERLPGPEDCDAEKRCWLLTVEDEYPQWRLHSIEGNQPGGATMIWVPVDSSPGVMVDCFYTSHWLPAHALPTPEATND